MTIKQAREAARQWMVEEGRALPGFCAAYTAGSTNWLPDDASLPRTSDLDVMVILDDANGNGARRKFIYQNALLEVSHLAKNRFRSTSHVLSDYHLAPSLRTTKLVFDPLGFLAPLLGPLHRDYAKGRWVRRRCAHAKGKLLQFLDSFNDSAPLVDQAITCLFAAGIATHILLVAGLRNPTVRTRYRAVREVLANFGHAGFHENLLEMMGAVNISRAQAYQYLATLTDVFDIAKLEVRTPFSFASDISDSARAMAIDGSLELIERGNHREAMFWMTVTYSRCLKVLVADAPGKLARSFLDAYQELLGSLALSTPAAVQQRCAEIRRMLPRVCGVADSIIEANEEIEVA